MARQHLRGVLQAGCQGVSALSTHARMSMEAGAYFCKRIYNTSRYTSYLLPFHLCFSVHPCCASACFSSRRFLLLSAPLCCGRCQRCCGARGWLIFPLASTRSAFFVLSPLFSHTLHPNTVHANFLRSQRRQRAVVFLLSDPIHTCN